MGVIKMYKAELTEEFKFFCEKVISGEIEAVQCEGESAGYTEARYGELTIFGYPWCSAKQEAEDHLKGAVSVKGYLDGIVYRLHIKNCKNTSIACVHSWKGSAWTKSKYFKLPARVALESLRKRLDGGVL